MLLQICLLTNCLPTLRMIVLFMCMDKHVLLQSSLLHQLFTHLPSQVSQVPLIIPQPQHSHSPPSPITHSTLTNHTLQPHQSHSTLTNYTLHTHESHTPPLTITHPTLTNHTPHPHQSYTPPSPITLPTLTTHRIQTNQPHTLP